MISLTMELEYLRLISDKIVEFVQVKSPSI